MYIFTRTLNPVTSAKEVAIATPEKETSIPKCPTIIKETTCRRYWDTVTATIGAAMELTLFNSWQNVLSDDDATTSTPLLLLFSCPSPLFLGTSSGAANSLFISLELSIYSQHWSMCCDVLWREEYIGRERESGASFFYFYLFLPNHYFVVKPAALLRTANKLIMLRALCN